MLLHWEVPSFIMRGVKVELTPVEYCFCSVSEVRNFQKIASFCVLDAVPNFTRLQQRLEQVVKCYPRLSQKIIGRHALFWEDDQQFCLDNHLEFFYLPNLTSEVELRAEVGKRFSAGFPKDRSPWQFSIFSNQPATPYSPPASSPPTSSAPASLPPIVGLMFSLHHALADGIGGMEILDAMCSKARENEVDVLKIQEAPPLPKRSLQAQWRKIQTILRRLTLVPFEHRPKSALNGLNSETREISTVEFPLALLNQLKRHFGVTLNDLLLGVLSRVLELYELRGGSAPNQLRAIIPVTTRSRHDYTLLGNNLEAGCVMLPLGGLAFTEKFRAVHEQLTDLKAHPQRHSVSVLSPLALLVPPRMRRILCDHQARKTNLICTNVPGPKRPRYFCGAQIISNFGLPALLTDHGVGFCLMSYAGKECIGIVTDPSIVSNPSVLVTMFQQAITEVEALRKYSQRDLDQITAHG